MNADIEQQCEIIAAQVARQGWCACPRFIAPDEARALRERLREWWEEGELRQAGVGRGANFRVRDDIRRDYVRWLDLSIGGRFSAFLQRHFEPLRVAVNRTMFLGLYEYEGHVTVYPPGAFYRRHIDRFQDASHRWLSVILYLNENWSADDGGQLRLFLPGDDGERAIDVLPEDGTLVAFLSHEIPHEVLPTRRERFSLTGWFRTRQ